MKTYTIALVLALLAGLMGAYLGLVLGAPCHAALAGTVCGAAMFASVGGVFGLVLGDMWEVRSYSRLPARGSAARAGRDLAREARERSVRQAAQARTIADPEACARVWEQALRAKGEALSIAERRVACETRGAQGRALTRSVRSARSR